MSLNLSSQPRQLNWPFMKIIRSLLGSLIGFAIFCFLYVWIKNNFDWFFPVLIGVLCVGYVVMKLLEPSKQNGEENKNNPDQ